MGIPESEIGKGNLNPTNTEAQMSLSQHVQTQAERNAQIAAPSSAGERMWDVTKDGVSKIGEGFVNSLDPHNILPNVGMGVAIGAAAKLILPETGPVGRVAAAALGAYFVAEPVVKSYSLALAAKNMNDMNIASDHLGNTLGGMPVAMFEGGIGAKLGAGLMGKALATEAAAPFTEWKSSMYGKADLHMQSGMASVRNTMFERLGVGTPDAGPYAQGIIPPYMLETLAKLNPDNPDFMATIKRSNDLRAAGQFASRTSVRADQGGAREVYDAGGEEVHPGNLVRKEGQGPSGNADADNAYDYTGDVRTYYKEVHGRNSIDGKGMKLSSTVNYGDNFENAFWDGQQMTYGRPGPQSPFKTFIQRMITGHEMTHGVTEFEANETYRGQPGALNESNSDVFGALVEQRALGQTADKASWLVGDGIWKDGINGRALRDMRNPGTAYNDAQIGKDPQPAHMRDFVRTTRDNGGVHINSGIPNKAFADFAVAVGGNAWEAPGKIWFEARAQAGSDPSFAQFAYQTIEAAKRISPNDVPKLQKAWSDVGVTPSAKATADVTPIVVNDNSDKKSA
ncbi:MAG TPA: M4 family metallopeptidase [Drouetiella sp.]|jgi:Thermolysin metallopeptidase, alpha-helical domain/Thermolysin metallopeptidase, catalytic domain